MINYQVAEKMFKSEQKYSTKLWKAVYTNVFNVLKTSSELVSYREEILQIWWQIILLVTEVQTAVSFKEVYEKYYKIFKEQVAQSGSLFVKRV